LPRVLDLWLLAGTKYHKNKNRQQGKNLFM
jgi:hypothetical protein